MGNQGSFMEKVYVYLPVLMCHSKMDYTDKGTIWNIRAAYFGEQASTSNSSGYCCCARVFNDKEAKGGNGTILYL